MGESKVKFGDKMFLYAQFIDLEQYDEIIFDNAQYNCVMGYQPVGGFFVTPIKSAVAGACLPGFVGDFLYEDSLAPKTPFSNDELEDVTDILALQSPLPQGCRVWMPIPSPRYLIR